MNGEWLLSLLLGLVVKALSSPVFLVCFAVGIAVWEILRRRPRRQQGDYPAELARAKLVMSEQDILADVPIPLAGRPDEVYRQSSGHLVPVETKTRNRAKVHREDLIQLSVYRVLLQRAKHNGLPGRPGRPVAGYGFVRIVTPSGVRWRRVVLMSEAEVVQLYERRIALESGRVCPTVAKHPALCQRCAYRDTCGPGRPG